jgi:hypothetical protein
MLSEVESPRCRTDLQLVDNGFGPVRVDGTVGLAWPGTVPDLGSTGAATGAALEAVGPDRAGPLSGLLPCPGVRAGMLVVGTVVVSALVVVGAGVVAVTVVAVLMVAVLMVVVPMAVVPMVE